jgi:hypothetical protein
MSPPDVDAALRKLAWAVALGLAALAATSGFHRHAFDAYVHMFFGDHYARDWFSVDEPRWYGGFSVLTYPPLAHQLVALASMALGSLEAGYVAVMVVAMSVAPWCVGQAARAFTDERGAAWAMLLAALWPTAHRFAWVYGQLPMLVATPFALLAMASLHRFLSSSRLVHLAAFAACVGATVGAHHVTSIFVAGGCLLIGLRHLAAPERGGRGGVVLRGAVAAIVAGVVIAGVIWPFWRFAQGEPQAEIPHHTRAPLWERALSMELVEQWVVLALAAALTVFAAARRAWVLAVLGVGVTFLSVLAGGTSTRLPELLFRSQWRWLTYDKFHHWAALLLCVALGGLVFTHVRRLRVVTAALALVLLPASLFLVGHKTAESLQPPFVHDLSNILSVLNGPDAARYRHLALGFGDQFCRFDLYGASPNVDGDYHTARTDPLLRQSGVATLDASKYYARGPEVLADVLRRAPELSLRWVIVNDEAYYPALLEAGFELAQVWENGVSLFERASVPPLPVVTAPPQRSLHWGLVPMTCLVLAVVVLVAARRADQVTRPA